MANKEEILAVRKARSEEISKQVRFIAFGIIAMVYTTLSSSSVFSVSMADRYETLFLLVLIFSTLAIAFDYLQFLFGYISAKKVNLNEPNEEGSYSYNTKSLTHGCITAFYYIKQISLGVAVIFLIYIMVNALF